MMQLLHHYDFDIFSASLLPHRLLQLLQRPLLNAGYIAARLM